MAELAKVFGIVVLCAAGWIGVSMVESVATQRPLIDCIIYPACGTVRP